MMKQLFLFLFMLLGCTLSSHATGGMDSGGTTGLPYRLQNAAKLSIQVLANVLPDDLKLINLEVYEFYLQHRTDLIIESATANLKVVPADQVFVVVNEQRLPRAMITGLTKGAPILIADTLNVTNPAELTQNLIHEYGHHLGVSQENDIFLDKLSLILVMKAIEKGVDLLPKVFSCISSDELLFRMTGTWAGKATYVQTINPWLVALNISSSGQYSDRTICEADTECSKGAFYYGMFGNNPNKRLRVQSVCGGEGNGTIDIVYDTGAVRTFKLEMIKMSPDWKELSFDMILSFMIKPIHFELTKE